MSVTENINEWLGLLGKDAGATFRLDENDQCVLASEDGYQVGIYVPDISGKVYFTSEIMELPQENCEAYLLNSLALNLFQQVTQGAAVSYDPSSNYLILSSTQDMQSKDYEAFEATLNNLAGIATEIRENLRELEHHMPTGTPQSEPNESSGMIRA
ncbi:hypothetical protein BTA51_04970 [Hahella sp. CCB-MM4]|uniref:CesT family type III secretion system chaperone n=1 Tax=Hahella sp. (strain CCB-MM4) TaxID=1926491 RepID=UPI000BD23B2D|nr:CesT family type III secretion system chaperone [Hahella sp. CCB-MM4]OZG74366.1 hypothetical protein BTA51_04970 [Hahella sp. CCB-MM4]